MDIQNKKIPEDIFHQMRQEVLTQWPTGKDVDLQEAVDYHKSMPQSRDFGKKLLDAKAAGRTLVQPRAGVPVIEEHIKLLQYLESEGEADLLPSTIDSYTRQNRYEEAENGISESIRLGRALLNGFPAVNHGVAGCRRVVESVNTPVQVRHGTPDARLLTEITYAGGFTSYEGGGISYNLPYCKNIPMERTIRDWQYVDRLTGLYEEMGVSINREPYGPLTGTLVPPCISHAAAIIEALLAAEQGVKNITVGYGQCGNLVQDIAAIRTLEELTDEYLHKYGYGDVQVTTVLHQWMGGFPADEAKAFGVIGSGSMIAALSKATKVIVKSPHEAVGIPTMEANAQGLRCTKQVVNMMADQNFTGSALEAEKEIIREETRAIVDKCFELGHGDIALGVCRGVEAGVLDVPFAPCRANAGVMLPCRDNEGAVRILKMGNLPFSDSLKKFHEEKIAERAKAENREPSFQMVIDDVYAIGKGRLVGRPRY
ncbi:MAG: methylaspartate mutase subunit E [Oscillospiraceae bacterium]|nr:methylaspartate mutase subunit E [Oscillospiraceae bacterium]